MTKAELEALAVVFVKSIVRQIDVEEVALTAARALSLDSYEEQTMLSYLLDKRDDMERSVTLG